MKFLSFDHFVLVMTALLMTNMLTNDEHWVRYGGIALVCYGMLVINRRVMDVLKKLEEKKNDRPTY